MSQASDPAGVFEPPVRLMLSMLDAVDALLVVLDIDGRVVLLNQCCQRLTGYRLQDLQGRTIWDVLLAPEEADAVERGFAELKRTAAPSHHQNVWLTRDGERRLIAWSDTVVRDDDGAPRYVVGIGQDLTGHSLSDQVAVEQQAVLQGVLETAVDGIMTIDETGTLMSANSAAERLFGFRGEEMLGRNVKILMPEPYHSEHDRYLSHYLETGEKRIIGIGREVIGRRKDGSTFPMELAVSETVVHGRRLFTGIVHDVSERKRAEALNTRLGRIIEQSANEVFVFDAESLCYLQANHTGLANLGYSASELRELTPFEVIPELDREHFEHLVEPLRSGARDQIAIESTQLRKDGSHYDAEIRLQLVPSEQPPVFFAIVQDVTEKKSREQQLRHVQKMEAIGQLTGGVAHDFNNLLTVILGNLEMLEAGLDDAALSELLVEAREAAELGAQLTDRLLAFARRQVLAPKPIDLNQLILGMLDLLRRSLGEAMHISTVLGSGLWHTIADPGQVENALLNLAINARDAMPEGGALTIETANVSLDPDTMAIEPDGAPGDYVMLSVSDTGCGMKPEVLQRALEPFFTTKDQTSGSGLGLSMVYGFTKQSGGHLRLYSEFGHGTTVCLYLPRAEAAEAQRPSAAAPSRNAPGRGETVLVVEDDARVRRITVRRLSELGYRVLEAEHGQAALEILEGRQPVDVLFTDIVMPGGMGGREVADQAVRLRRDIKVLFTSGFAPQIVAEQGLVDATRTVLRKPYSSADLARHIRSLLET